MAPKKYRWLTAWLLFTAPMMTWDAGYCLMRPRSLAGGDLYWLWKPYELYSQFDHVYGTAAFENGEGFAPAAAILNLLEISTGLVYLFLVYILPTESAPLVGYTGATMTLAKTVLYVTQELFCGFCAIGHNSMSNIWACWIMPNIVWSSFSIATMYTLGGDIASALRNTKAAKSI